MVPSQPQQLSASISQPDSAAALAWLSARDFALHPRASWRRVGHEFFVVTADRSFHRLQVATAVAVVQRLTAGAASGTDLLAAVVRAFEVDEPRAAVDLHGFLTQLVERQVVAASPPQPAQGEVSNPDRGVSDPDTRAA